MRKIMALVAVLLLFGCDRPPDRPPDDEYNAAGDLNDDTDLYQLTDEDTLVSVPVPDSALHAPMRRMPVNEGLPVGPTLWLSDKWCSGFVSGTVASGMPERIVAVLDKADRCNIRIALTLPRSLLTTNGEQKGPFSPTRARRAVDLAAAALAKVPASGRDNLLYYSVLDDMGCEPCWGGKKITQSQTAAHTRYARSKFPAWAAVGLRVDPAWMVGIQAWGVDVATAQWHMRKGPKNLSGIPKQRAWYEASRLAAPKVGVKRIIYTVNVHDCEGAPPDGNTRPCTPSELRAFGETALNFDPSQNCGFLGWRYDGVYFGRNDYQDVWRHLVNLGRQKPKLACKA